jgi:drug/metabolite transporter (DMT)-like permease
MYLAPGENRMLMNIFYISIVAFGTIVAQLTLKKGLLLLGGIDFSSGFLPEVFRVVHSPYVLGAFVLQGTIALFWMVVLSRTRLVFLFTMSGAFFYILLALASWIVLGERLTPVQWLGIFMISLGVVFFNLKAL